jgi:PAS domain S-box-containing protein
LRIPRRWRLLALLIGPVMLTLGLASAMNYYSHQVAITGYQSASAQHVATTRAAFEANAVSSETLELIRTIAEEINARRAGERQPEDWPAFRRAQEARLGTLHKRLQGLLAEEQDTERRQALKEALVLMGDLQRFLATSDALMAQPLDVVNQELLASRNTSLRYALQLQRFNEAMSKEGVAHLKAAEAEVERYSTHSTQISGIGLLAAAALWAVAAVVLARRLEVLDRAVARLAQGEHASADQDEFAAVREIARAQNPLTSTLAQSVLTLQQVQRERDAAQIALQEREQLFSTIVKQAPAGIALIARDTLGMLRFNEAAYRSLGYDADEFAARTLHDLAFGKAARLDEVVEQVFSQGGVEFEATSRTKAGELRDYWMSMKPLALPGRDCISAIWLDITERKRAEFELDRYRKHLESLVAERTRDLERTQQDLIVARDMAESASRAKSAFLANMSHEIRTPMNAIVGMAHLLKGEALSPRQQERVDKITGAAMHLLAVINDILDFSKIEAGKFSVDPTDFNLEQVVSQAFSLVADKAEAKNLELVSDLDHVPTALHGDPIRLGQILLNFLSNAVKFTEHGHVRLRVRKLRHDENAQWLRFEIADTGIGISPEQQTRLFTAFQQADDSTTRLYGGTGLGLAICGRLANLLGGSVGVHSAAGQGSTFWVELPFTLAAHVPPVLHGFPPDARVLVMDDMEEAREAVQVVLRQLGATRVDTCANGEQGLTRVVAAAEVGMPYTHVFADWNMPGMTGAEALRQLRHLPLPVHPVGILFSGSSGSPEHANPEAGIDGFIAKPVLPSAVVSVLARTALGGAHSPVPPPHAADVSTGLKPGQRVLLAEDNALNREVLGELLERLGVSVDSVPDGVAAVEAASRSHYDLVLMDLQMPRMDGLQAARALRQVPSFGTTPIIAVTANAFTEDRANALAAGMNDHLAKPVDPAALCAVLTRWLGAPASADDTTELQEALPTATQAALERVHGLSVSAALRHTGGSAAQLHQRLRRFFDEHGADPATICLEAAQGDAAAARTRAHTLRGVARMFGLERIGQAAEEIESLLQQGGDAEPLADHPAMQRLTTAMSESRQAFAQVSAPDAHGENAEPSLAPDELLTGLQTLADLLAVGDMDAADAWERLAPQLTAHFKRQTGALGDVMARFDYGKALAIVRDMLSSLNRPQN